MQPSPPKYPLRFLRWFCREDYLDEIEGDLLELFEKRVEKSPGKARRRFVWDVVKSFRIRNIKSTSSQNSNYTAMFQHYFKISWRNLGRNKANSAINIGGLALGLASCMLIFLYVADELSYDRFHRRLDQIYQLTYTFEYLKDKNKNYISSTNISAGKGFQQEIPEVETIVRMSQGSGLIVYESNVVRQEYFYVDANFFEVFSFPLLYGSAETALLNEHSIVVSEDVAIKYFGSADVVGKEIRISDGTDERSYSVSAVAQNPPQNSSIKFGMMLPFSIYERQRKVGLEDWFSGYLNTFMVLQTGSDPVLVEEKFAVVLDKYAGETLKQLTEEYNVEARVSYGLQSLEDLHLSQKFSGSNGLTDSSDPVYSYILGGLAVFILLIACFNFVNISVAQSFRRAKEIGIRKTCGGNRGEIAKQFFSEAFFVCMVSYALALAITYFMLPLFNELANKHLSLSYLANEYIVAGFLLLLVLTGITSGTYPAIILSKLSPTKTLTGRQKITGKHSFAKGLVIVQFALASFLVVGTVTIYSQVNLLVNADPGYDDKNLIRVHIPESLEQVKVLQHGLSQSTAIKQVSAKSRGYSYRIARVGEEDINTFDFKVDENYLNTLGVPLLTGRNISGAYGADPVQSVVVNETFVHQAGWGEHALGQTLKFLEDDRTYRVVGIAKDYHFRPLRNKIEPLVLHMRPDRKYGELLIKITPEEASTAIGLIEEKFREQYSLEPFEYNFVEFINAREYQAEQRWKNIVSCAAFLAILISCVGLFGLAALSIQQRTKEIGIRKVLGASVANIVVLVSRQFFMLVLLAIVIATPAGLYATERWLQNFAYRIQAQDLSLVATGVVILAIAIITTSYQAFKAATENPVKSLKNE